MRSRLISGDSLKDEYIFRLTDDTGMLQHSKCGIPDPRHGYTTDDNARALIMALMLNERFKEKKYTGLAYRYASFLLNAQNPDGTFKNFMGHNREWLEEKGSEDCFGRCLWAMGYGLSSDSCPQDIKQGLRYMMDASLPHAASLHSPRGRAYSLIGLSMTESRDVQSLILELGRSLCLMYEEHSDGEWKWFEDIIAYCNSILPFSLIRAFRVTGKKSFLETAEASLAFLEKATFRNGCFRPVGCKGWYRKGFQPAEYDEQTVEACESVLTYLEAYRITRNSSYLQKAKQCHSWYLGANSKGISLIDRETGGCYDGLTEKGVNLNKGAESQISYVISYLAISDMTQGGVMSGE